MMLKFKIKKSFNRGYHHWFRNKRAIYYIWAMAFLFF